MVGNKKIIAPGVSAMPNDTKEKWSIGFLTVPAIYDIKWHL